VSLTSETEVLWTSAGKVLNNVCPSSPPPKIAATFKKYAQYTII